MRKIIPVIVALSLLTACSKTVAVVPTPVAPPALPEALRSDPGPLPPIVSNDIQTLLRDGIEADRRYHDLRMTNRALVKLYECVAEVISTGKDPSICL